MKASDIQVGHIYYVDYEPTRRGEFGKLHMCVVIKKNNDLITFVTVPLTSQEDAPYDNKFSLGIIDSLPDNLREKESFAVLDQIRTLNASRFRKLKHEEDVVDAYLNESQMSELLKALIKDFLADTSDIIKREIANNLLKN